MRRKTYMHAMRCSISSCSACTDSVKGESATLLDAVDSGVPGAVTVALKGMTGAQAARDFADPDVIMRVAKSGDRDAFESFFDAMVDMQSEQEVGVAFQRLCAPSRVHKLRRLLCSEGQWYSFVS